jgi:hypothetical protein
MPQTTDAIRRYVQDMHPTWTFVRHGDHLVLERVENADGIALVVTSDQGSRRIPFHDVSALVVFQCDMESFLVGTGWSLLSFAPDRRHYDDRRLFPRDHPDRRRWWTDGTARPVRAPREDDGDWSLPDVPASSAQKTPRGK